MVDVALEDDLQGGSKSQRQSGLGAGEVRRGSRRMEWGGMANAHSGSFFLVRQGEIFSDADGMAGVGRSRGPGVRGRGGVHRESATGTQVSGGEDRM